MNESDQPCFASSISTGSCRVAVVVTALCVAMGIAHDAFDHSDLILVIAIVATAPYVANGLVVRKLAHRKSASLVLCALAIAICIGRLILTVGFTLVMLFDRPSPGCSMIGILLVFELWVTCGQCAVVSLFFVYWVSTRWNGPVSQQLSE